MSFLPQAEIWQKRIGITAMKNMRLFLSMFNSLFYQYIFLFFFFYNIFFNINFHFCKGVNLRYNTSKWNMSTVTG